MKKMKQYEPKPIPCEDCISLPMCISFLNECRIQQLKDNKERMLYVGNLVTLESSSFMFIDIKKKHCSLLHDYIFDIDNDYHYHCDRVYSLIGYLLKYIKDTLIS